MSKVADAVAEFLVTLICNNPRWVVGFLFAFFLATLVNHGLKLTWSYAEMPRWARFVIGFTMPIALNFDHIVRKQTGADASEYRDACKQP